MQKLGNRIIIILCCSFVEVQVIGTGAGVVIGILLAFIISCIGLYSGGDGIKMTAILGYVLLSLQNQTLLLSYPVVVYEVISLLRNKTVRPWVIGVGSFMGFWMALHLKNYSAATILGEIGIICIAIWLNQNSYRYGQLESKYIVTQDNSTELALKLKNENRFLQEKQDSDIYAATLKERNRIAREIHDNVGHMLSRAILMTGALLTVTKEESRKQDMKNLKECLDEAMTSIRESVHDLHDESIDIEQSVKKLTEGLTDYHVSMEYDMTKMIPREVKYCLVSIVKETISNIIRHSNGDQIQISLIEHPGLYKLAVEDNGDCEKGRYGEGIGLQNMRDRVESLSGNLNITAEKTGFRVYVSIPKNR